MKIIDQYKNEFEIPEKLLNSIYKEEFKSTEIPICFAEYPSNIEMNISKRTKDELSEEEYRKKLSREIKRIEKCISKCKYKNKCLLVSMLSEIRNVNFNISKNSDIISAEKQIENIERPAKPDETKSENAGE